MTTAERMKYFHYTARLQDGPRVEHIDVVLAITAEHMLRFGFIWMVERVALGLRQRLKFDHILEYHVQTISAADAQTFTERPWMVADSWREK